MDQRCFVSVCVCVCYALFDVVISNMKHSVYKSRLLASECRVNCFCCNQKVLEIADSHLTAHWIVEFAEMN